MFLNSARLGYIFLLNFVCQPNYPFLILLFSYLITHKEVNSIILLEISLSQIHKFIQYKFSNFHFTTGTVMKLFYDEKTQITIFQTSNSSFPNIFSASIKICVPFLQLWRAAYLPLFTSLYIHCLVSKPKSYIIGFS